MMCINRILKNLYNSVKFLLYRICIIPGDEDSGLKWSGARGLRSRAEHKG